jgi:hypothetical protein
MMVSTSPVPSYQNKMFLGGYENPPAANQSSVADLISANFSVTFSELI